MLTLSVLVLYALAIQTTPALCDAHLAKANLAHNQALVVARLATASDSIGSASREVSTNYCGTDANDALKCEGQPCPDLKCPAGQFCWAGIVCPGSKPAWSPRPFLYCGAGYADAVARCDKACPYSTSSECDYPREHCYNAQADCPAEPPILTPSATPSLSPTASISSTSSVSPSPSISPLPPKNGKFCGPKRKPRKVARYCAVPCTKRKDCEKDEKCVYVKACYIGRCGKKKKNAYKCDEASECGPSGNSTCPSRQKCYKFPHTKCFAPSKSPSPDPSTSVTMTPTSTPTNSVTPTVSVSPVDAPLFSGYYSWTWTGGTTAFNWAHFSVAFSGWMNTDNAIRESDTLHNKLAGDKFICFGGGNHNGRFSVAGINGINAAVLAGSLERYKGIVYDIEEGDAGLSSHLENSFNIAKDSGFVVIVTISHSAPYGISDSHAVMDTILGSSNVDYVSPQLYTTGYEGSNDYAITHGYRWEEYVGSKPKMLPSIVHHSYYEHTKEYYRAKGITTYGFIQWRQ